MQDELAIKTIRCCIAECDKTARNPQQFSEWLCSKHWRVVDLHLRDGFRSAMAAYNQVHRDKMPAEHIKAVAKLLVVTWDLCVADAKLKVERASRQEPEQAP